MKININIHTLHFIFSHHKLNTAFVQFMPQNGKFKNDYDDRDGAGSSAKNNEKETVSFFK